VASAGVSRIAASTTAKASTTRLGRSGNSQGRAPVVCGDRLKVILAGVSGMFSDSRLARGALPQATACQARSTAQTTPIVGGPNIPTATAMAAQADATTDSGSVPSTALPNRDGVRTLGVRKNTPRVLSSAVRHARATVQLSASMTIAASGTSRHAAPHAARMLQPNRSKPATNMKIGSTNSAPTSWRNNKG
jgi:hypothetical protein